VSAGTHLGFEVEFGSYTSTGADIPYDGRWRAITGEDILVEVKSSPWPLGSVNQLGAYMDEFAEHTGRERGTVFGLYVIGYGDFTGLVDQIRGSDFRQRIKVISFSDLIRLFALTRVLKGSLAPERAHGVVQDLLLPFDSINVGNIIAIIQGVAAATDTTGIIGEPSQKALAVGREWTRTELNDFMGESQPNQVALLAAICSMPNCVVSGDELVRRMRIVSPRVQGNDPSQVITQKTIGGTRSGMSRREQQLGKDSFMEYRAGRYSIREDYREWVVDWLKQRNLLPTAEEFAEKPDGLFAQTGTGMSG
jgi:hypothetical protein